MRADAREEARDLRLVARPRPRICLTRLKLTDFRSYAAADLAFYGAPAVFFGENGTGKTNLLEAVSLLSPGRGLRGAAAPDMARQGGPGGWAIATEVETPDGERRIGTGITLQDLEEGRSRKVRIDGETQSGSGVLAGHIRVVWLTPAMDRLFVESAGGRRRFLDRMVMGFDPAHGTRVNAYDKAVRERNRLLADDIMDGSWHAALEAQIAELGVAIAAARTETVAALSHRLANPVAGRSPFPQAALTLEGRLEEALEGAPATDVEDAFRDELAQTRRRDQAAGRTLAGPHRSDLDVAHVAKGQAARLCSTGEQKALLIGLVLAQARLLSEAGTPPFLLMDEIAAHLDESRRAALFDEIVEIGLQAFMTGTDRHLFEMLETRGQFWAVADGTARAAA